jgi:uncharacterized membrane protein (DUF4010 family)
MRSVRGRRAVGGLAWGAAAFVLATVGLLVGSSRVTATWRACLGQDHEPVPGGLRVTLSVWVVMLTVLLALIAVLRPLPKSRWYLLPVMVVVAAVLTWLYVIGTGHPPPLRPGDAPQAGCGGFPAFPFTG